MKNPKANYRFIFKEGGVDKNANYSINYGKYGGLLYTTLKSMAISS